MRIAAPFHLPAPLRALLLGVALLPALSAQAEVKLDVPYIVTHNDTVHRMLEMAEVTPDDVLVDLGSGDGRIVIQAALDWGIRDGLGVDIDPERVAEARAAARAAGVDDRVRFIQGDLFELDFSNATVLTMYLLEALNLRLRPVILERLAPGTRVISHVFGMGDWKPDQTVLSRGIPAHLWIVPAKVQGQWRIELPDGSHEVVDFYQRYQEIEGSYVLDGITHGMNFAKLRGTHIRFSARDRHYIGRIDGNRMSGLPGPGVVPRWHAERIRAETSARAPLAY
ncbi:MAG: class I SAM-dependent methyltransferase [Pseudazoarcus pumilus]|nr:class I SAM-dependent methyltransferase [Pseudazoarcus pumilus]